MVGVLTLMCIALLSACGTDDAPAGPVSSTGEVATSSSTASAPQPVPNTVSYPPPYIDHVTWVQTAVGPSLQVYPTTSGRYTADESAMNAAWAEVVRLDRSADTPSMRAQFDCHWRFARIVEPEKPSWNLEPGRPVVDENTMIATRCNPGFAEE